MYFDNYLEYNDSLPISSRIRYEVEVESFYFLSEDFEGFELELSTSVELVWKVRKGTYSAQAESPCEYFDQYELIASNTGLVTDWNTGCEVNPEEVLTESEYIRYNQQLQDFISAFE